MTVSIKRPTNSLKIDENSHVGLHIRQRRLELRLEQKDLAVIFGVCEDTITGWENGRSEPLINYSKAVIEFLGYTPYLYETETLGGRVKLYRLLNGLSHEATGKLFGVDGTTV